MFVKNVYNIYLFYLILNSLQKKNFKKALDEPMSSERLSDLMSIAALNLENSN